MKKHIRNGNSSQIEGKLKQEFADLTDDDKLYFEEGKEDAKTTGRLQKNLASLSKKSVKTYANNKKNLEERSSI